MLRFFLMVSADSLDFYTIQISYIEARHCETLDKECARWRTSYRKNTPGHRAFMVP